MAVENPEAAALFAKIKFKIKGEQFIYCRPGKICGNNAVTGEGLLIFTTNNNFECVLRLLGMLRPNSISPYYQIISRSIKRDMDKELYDRLIYIHQEEVNQQGYIELTNVDTDLFDTLVNFHPKHPQSVSQTVKTFLQGPGKVLAIELTIDTEESGTYRLITNNKDHDIAIKKLRELQIYLMKEKDTSPTMISSFERFGAYLEVNGRPLIGDSTSDQVERLESQVKDLFVPTQKNTPYNPLVQLLGLFLVPGETF